MAKVAHRWCVQTGHAGFGKSKKKKKKKKREKELRPCHLKWSVTEIEALASVHFANKYRSYLANGKKHLLLTDHIAAVRLAEKDGHANMPHTIQRLLIFIQDLDFEWVYGPGSKQIMSDMASRFNNSNAIAPENMLQERSVNFIASVGNRSPDALRASDVLLGISQLSGVATPLTGSVKFEHILHRVHTSCHKKMQQLHGYSEIASQQQPQLVSSDDAAVVDKSINYIEKSKALICYLAGELDNIDVKQYRSLMQQNYWRMLGTRPQCKMRMTTYLHPGRERR